MLFDKNIEVNFILTAVALLENKKWYVVDTGLKKSR